MKMETSRRTAAALVLACCACCPLFGQRSAAPEREKAIPRIEVIAAEIRELPASDVRASLAPEKHDAPEERRAELKGRIRASQGVRIREVKHWDADASPFFVEFEGRGTVSLELPRKLAEAEGGRKARPKTTRDAYFVTVTVQPALSKDPAERSYLLVGGAAIAFGLEPPTRGIRAGSVFLLNAAAGRAAPGEWFNAGFSLPVNEDCQMAMPLELTLRIDPEAGEWDLFMMNRLRFAGIRLGRPSAGVSFRSAGEGPTLLSELAELDSNPFFADADSDGIEDSVEEELGFSSKENDRQALDELGEFTNLQHFMNLRKVYRSRSERELEETLLEAVATRELGQEPSEALVRSRIPDELRKRPVETREEFERKRVEAARRLRGLGRKAEVRVEPPSKAVPAEREEGQQ